MTRTSSTMNKKWSRSMMMSCSVTGLEQRGEVANGQSEGLCYDTAGHSVLDVSGAVVGPLTRAGPEKGH